MEDLRFSGTAWKKQKVRGFDAPLPAEFTAFEKQAFARYAAAQQKARTLLEKGKRVQAVEVLNSQAAALWQKAVELLGIQEK